MKDQPRRLKHSNAKPTDPRKFDYSQDYRNLNLRENPEIYRVGVGEQGVLLVEPYKSEILPLWRFKTPEVARKSARDITAYFEEAKAREDFIGMDMARKFLQMGFTRARRYANHKSGRKWASDLKTKLAYENDDVKAKSAAIFWDAWHAVEADDVYLFVKQCWREIYG